jgi:hypothetical protein
MARGMRPLGKRSASSASRTFRISGKLDSASRGEAPMAFDLSLLSQKHEKNAKFDG